jgi:methylated-DNA-[protein]-cysteine S-methyltransferase
MVTHRRPIAAVVQTVEGWVAIARTERGLCRSTLPQSTRAQALCQLGLADEAGPPEDDPLLSRAGALIQAYFEGEPVRFDLPLDLSGIPEFTRSVLLACNRIPYGETASYGELARKVGKPGAGRAVGQAMRRNPLPPIIPCHRVIGSDGSLTGFAGGTEGLPVKQALLDREKGTGEVVSKPVG